MPEYSAKRDPTRCPSHPGVLLRKVVIPATGRSKAEIAALLGISRQHLHDILAEKKPVSAHVAVRLGKLFGDGAGVWLRMQAAYDTWHAERELAAEEEDPNTNGRVIAGQDRREGAAFSMVPRFSTRLAKAHISPAISSPPFSARGRAVRLDMG